MEKTSKEFPSYFSFMEYLYEKSAICDLVSDGINFIPPSRNIDMLLQIDVKYKFIFLT